MFLLFVSLCPNFCSQPIFAFLQAFSYLCGFEFTVHIVNLSGSYIYESNGVYTNINTVMNILNIHVMIKTLRSIFFHSFFHSCTVRFDLSTLLLFQPVHNKFALKH
jgi:hypothetical protein